MTVFANDSRSRAGWFQLAWSSDLASEAVIALESFDEPLALYRGMSGQPLLIEPFCPHMGAHLGIGGRVVAEDIVCPFHGWRWGPDGHNVDIPYSDDVNRRRKVVHRTVVEKGGAIWTWFSPDGRPPDWELPTEFAAAGSPSVVQSWTVRSTVAAAMEVAADDGLLAHLVGGRGVSARGAVVDHSTFQVTLALAGEPVEVIEATFRGPGIVVVRSSTRPGWFAQTQTPTSGGLVNLRCAGYDLEDASPWWIEVLTQVAPILDHLSYTADLEGLPTEAVVMRLRDWATIGVGAVEGLPV